MIVIKAKRFKYFAALLHVVGTGEPKLFDQAVLQGRVCTFSAGFLFWRARRKRQSFDTATLTLLREKVALNSDQPSTRLARTFTDRSKLFGSHGQRPWV